MNKHFPKDNKFHKIFNKNTVKLSYSCTKNVSRLVKSHNKKVTKPKANENLICNCRRDCPMDNTGQCRAKSIVYKCVASVPNKPDKVYIGLTKKEFKERHYGHKTSLTNKAASNTALSDYIWKIREYHKIDPTLKWSILKSVPAYNNISKKCLLCLQEKIEILFYKKKDELLNKRSELVAKCKHIRKSSLAQQK